MDFKVVKIVDEYLVVVDYGRIHNAESDDILEIFQVGEEVIDPETHESLGTLDIIKAKIKVLNVYEKMSLCESNEYTRVNSSALNNFNSTLLSISQSLTRTEQKALNVNTKEITGGYSEGNKGYINLKDPVRIIHSSFEERQKEE
ncbi:hypothetical protein [Virgibacillus sediminis]|uniref:Uncharacterized protein n=1 Tax=Virgibacillus sediminis TaxID=202260 RepID=A0ABV7A6T9_9BACI